MILLATLINDHHAPILPNIHTQYTPLCNSYQYQCFRSFRQPLACFYFKISYQFVEIIRVEWLRFSFVRCYTKQLNHPQSCRFVLMQQSAKVRCIADSIYKMSWLLGLLCLAALFSGSIQVCLNVYLFIHRYLIYTNKYCQYLLSLSEDFARI